MVISDDAAPVGGDEGEAVVLLAVAHPGVVDVGDGGVALDADVRLLPPADGVDPAQEPVVLALLGTLDAHQPAHHRVDAQLTVEHPLSPRVRVGPLFFAGGIAPGRLGGTALGHRHLTFRRGKASAAEGGGPASVQHGGTAGTSDGRALTGNGARVKANDGLGTVAVGTGGVEIRVVDVAVSAFCGSHFDSSYRVSRVSGAFRAAGIRAGRQGSTDAGEKSGPPWTGSCPVRRSAPKPIRRERLLRSSLLETSPRTAEYVRKCCMMLHCNIGNCGHVPKKNGSFARRPHSTVEEQGWGRMCAHAIDRRGLS